MTVALIIQIIVERLFTGLMKNAKMNVLTKLIQLIAKCQIIRISKKYLIDAMILTVYSVFCFIRFDTILPNVHSESMQ